MTGSDFQSFFSFFSLLRQGYAMLPRLALNAEAPAALSLGLQICVPSLLPAAAGQAVIQGEAWILGRDGSSFWKC